MLLATWARVMEQAPGLAAVELRLEVSTVRDSSVAVGVATIALGRFLVTSGC